MHEELAAVLGGLAPAAIAVSGGVDSMTLAVFAHRHLGGEQIEIMHAISPAVPPEATARVRRYADAEGWRLVVLDAGEFADRDYIANPTNRCYFCKTNLYDAIAKRSDRRILSGTNTDDLGEYRPGLDAASEHAVLHPYLEAGIDKAANIAGGFLRWRDEGLPLTVKYMVIVIRGGLGGLAGPLAARLILGITETFVGYYLGSVWAPSVAYIAFILILLLRPQGLFGLKE